MAKAAKNVVEEESEEEEAYEVEAINKHKRRKDGILQYHITWKGYPSSEGHDTWEGEESADGCNEILEAYWKGVDPSKRHERFAPGSKEAKAYLAKLNANTPSGSKKRPADSVDSNGSNNRRASGRSVPAEKEVTKNGNGNKRAKKDTSVELESPARKPTAKAKKELAKVESEEEEVEEEGDEDVEDGYSTDGRINNTHEAELADEPSWEDHVKRIDTIERNNDGNLRLFVVWDEDDSYSWIGSDVARAKCPQKVIDFYENHLKFKVKTQSDAEE